ncbi:putative cell division inhibitor protein, partial [Escherichia coli EC1865]
MVMTK